MTEAATRGRMEAGMSGKVSNTLQVVRKLEKVEKEVALLRSDLNDGLAGVRSEMNEGVASVRGELIRVSTEIVSVVAAVHEVRDVLVERLDVRDKVDQLDRRVALLERKTG